MPQAEEVEVESDVEVFEEAEEELLETDPAKALKGFGMVQTLDITESPWVGTPDISYNYHESFHESFYIIS